MSVKLYPKTVIRTGGFAVTCLCLMETGKASVTYLLTGTDSGELLVWNLHTQVIINTTKIDETAAVLSIHRLHEQNQFVAFTRSQVLTFLCWQDDVKAFNLKCSYKTQAVCATFCSAHLCMLTVEEALIVAPSDKHVMFLKLHSAKPEISELKGSNAYETTGMVTCLSIFSDDQSGELSVFIGDEAGDLSLLKSGKATLDWSVASKVNLFKDHPVISLDFNWQKNTGVSVAVGTGDIVIWRLSNKEITKHLTLSTPSKGYNSVRIRSDCKLFICCSCDGLIRMFAPKKGSLLALIDFHRESVSSVVYSKDFSFITASKDSMVCIWDLYANK